MFQTDEEVIAAIGPRAAIGNAVAVLCAEHHLSREVALDMLAQGAVDANVPVRMIAATIVRQSDGVHGTR
jgi:AmiR/NasT family two-component response regulator